MYSQLESLVLVKSSDITSRIEVSILAEISQHAKILIGIRLVPNKNIEKCRACIWYHASVYSHAVLKKLVYFSKSLSLIPVFTRPWSTVIIGCQSVVGVCFNASCFVSYVEHYKFPPTPLAVTDGLSTNGRENARCLPSESGTVFWALRTTSATL